MHFGTATVDIVPPFRTRMYGYWNRFDQFDEVHDPIEATALYLSHGSSSALICSADIGMFPSEDLTERLIDRLAATAGCPAEHVLLNASHTHGGPAIPTHMPAGQAIENTESAYRFIEFLGDRLDEAVRTAVGSAEEGSLRYGCGVTSIPINRRLERDGRVVMAPNPAAPIEDRIRLLALYDKTETLRAVALVLACHPVATGGAHRLTADYPGAWRSAFRAHFGPGVTPLFLQGCGGDMRPRATADGDGFRTLSHGELAAIGDQILREMLPILSDGLEEIEVGPISATRRTVRALCERRYASRDDFSRLAECADAGLREYAEYALMRLDREGAVPDFRDYTVSTLWLNRRFALVGIPAEVLSGLGRTVEHELGPLETIVLGYTNGNGSYLPGTPESARGGFEAEGYLHEILTGPYLPGIEKLITGAIVP